MGTLVKKGQDLLGALPVKPDDYDSWLLQSQNYVGMAFGRDSPNVVDVTKRSGLLLVAYSTEEERDHQRALDLQGQIKKLEMLAEVLGEQEQFAAGIASPAASVSIGTKVFLVHGRDDAARLDVARFLEKLRLEVVILHEQPNGGRTLIEKFENYSDVGFALVLLTPDDRGGLAIEDASTYKPRARQNAIFELGYFIGRLTRQRVCALYSPGVEVPSDYSGVAFVELDKRGAWKMEVARELKDAKFHVDMNLAV